MTACEQYGAVLSANDLFKLGYRNYLRWAALAALSLTILFFIFMPRYEPTAYRLRVTVIEIYDYDIEAPEIVEPLPPPPVVRPPVIEIAPETGVETEFDWERVHIDFNQPVPANRFGDPDDGEVFVSVQSKPVLTYFHPPDYSRMARLMKLAGTVVVDAKVGEQGRVVEVKIARSVHPLLDQAALAAARRCQFQPGTQRTIPVAAWVAIPYRFVLH